MSTKSVEFLDGEKAFEEGLSRSSNPYNKRQNSDYWLDWNKGYDNKLTESNQEVDNSKEKLIASLEKQLFFLESTNDKAGAETIRQELESLKLK